MIDSAIVIPVIVTTTFFFINTTTVWNNVVASFCFPVIFCPVKWVVYSATFKLQNSLYNFLFDDCLTPSCGVKYCGLIYSVVKYCWLPSRTVLLLVTRLDHNVRSPTLRTSHRGSRFFLRQPPSLFSPSLSPEMTEIFRTRYTLVLICMLEMDMQVLFIFFLLCFANFT